MAKIAINLLPLEFRSEEIKRAKFVKIQTIGVATILLMIFLSSLTVALSILQSQTNQKIQAKLARAEQKVTDLKDIQVSLSLLKNRLTTINQFLGIPSNQVEIYKLVYELLPESVSVNAFSVDKAGEVSISAIAPDGETIDELVANLLSRDLTSDKIKQVNIETLNRGRDGIYRLSFKVKPKI